MFIISSPRAGKEDEDADKDADGDADTYQTLPIVMVGIF